MGALIMAHSDDEGLVLPPKLAPHQVVLVPVPFANDQLVSIMKELESELKAEGIRVKVDADDTKRPGFKFAEYEMLGVPVRIAVGVRDLEKGVLEVARRDTKEKNLIGREGIAQQIKSLLDEIQNNLFNKAKSFQQSHTTIVNNWNEFVEVINTKGGFAYAHYDGTQETEDKIKEMTQATARCIPIEGEKEVGTCILTGKHSPGRVLFAKAY
jgi:prolyl-tRNA synthetase